MIRITAFSLLLLTVSACVVNSFYVHYFAYGSNMNPDFLEKRTLSSKSSLTFERTVLRDYQLVFNIGVDSFGMAASVEPKKGGNTHGLTYKLSLPQFNLLLASEGFPVGYKIEPVKVKPYSGEGSIDALTLRSGNGLDSGKPSERYLKLLQKGAKDQDLDASYQQYLSEIQPMNSYLSRLRK